MELTLPKQAKLGGSYDIRASALEPGTLYRLTVTYAHRAESYKAAAAKDDHPEMDAGTLWLTERAEEQGIADVVLWDWDMTTPLLKGSFKVGGEA